MNQNILSSHSIEDGSSEPPRQSSAIHQPGNSGHFHARPTRPNGTNSPSCHSSSIPPVPDTSLSREKARSSKQHRLSRSCQPEWSTRWITDWWGIELICWAIAALSIAAIVITLEIYKGKPVPNWAFGITLNSIISIFATIGQMAMAKPLVECISQLKWLWFMQRRKLMEFQAFDDASRGPMGSLILLGRLYGTRLVCLGAAITIASTAFGPFSQQVVTYPLRLHPIGSAFTPQVFNYTATSGLSGWPSPLVTASFYEGLATLKSDLSTVPTSCSTGNCTWPEYTSLGICGSVADLSDTLQYNVCNTTSFDEIFQQLGGPNPGFQCFNLSLPDLGLIYLADTEGAGSPVAQLLDLQLTNGEIGIFGPGSMPVLAMAMSSTNTSSVSTAYLIYQPGLLTSLNSSLPEPLAYELNLNLCTQKYRTSVSKGRVDTVLVSTQNLPTYFNMSYTANNDTASFISNNSYTTIDGDVFGISAAGLPLLADLTQNVMDGGICFTTIFFENNTFGGLVNTTFCDLSPTAQLLSVLNTTDPLAGITNIWDSLATSMTNAFRTPASDTIGGGGDTAIRQFEGTAFTEIAFVETDYRWLILPISLVSLTLVFLLATIWESKRLGSRIWKSSNLATLQGLHSELHTDLGGLSSISKMGERAEKVKVSFDVKGGKAESEVEYQLIESKQEGIWRA